MAELTGTDSAITYLPLPTDDPVRRRPDITRATELLGWMPTIPLREGLRPTIAYFHHQQAEVPVPSEAG